LLLGYSRQSYYQGIKFIQQKAYEADIVIDEVLRYRKHQKRLGTRKLLHEMQGFLEAHNFQIGRDAMFNLLAERGLLITKRKRRGCITTLSKHRFKKYPNIIKGFIPIAPNQLWVSDITYIHLSDDFAYLSLITDAYSHKIVGFYLSEDLSAKGPLKALKMALTGNPDCENLIHHSDRGVQYCSHDYIKILKRNNIKISMTENGDPRENAIAERVNGIIKNEYLHRYYPKNIRQATFILNRAINLYNNQRPHLSISLMTPNHVHSNNIETTKKWKNYFNIKKVNLL
jgi:transposase InsO family protein